IAPENTWLEGLLDVSQVLELAPFRAVCHLTGGTLVYEYTFSPPPGMDQVKGRTVAAQSSPLSPSANLKGNSKLRIGPIRIDLRAYDRDPQILAFGVSDKKGLKDFLDSNGGIRVYRDGMRVYNYGEPENDWLELGQRRVNVPARRISNNLVLGAVSLSGSES